MNWPLQRGGRCREVYIRVNIWTVRRDKMNWPLQRGGRCREVYIRFNVWTVRRDKMNWPLQRGGRCREVYIRVNIGTLSSQDESVDDNERRRGGLGRERRPKREKEMFKQAPVSARRRSR